MNAMHGTLTAEMELETNVPERVQEAIKATQGGMTVRGVRTHGVDMITSKVLDCFRENPISRKEVLALMGHA